MDRPPSRTIRFTVLALSIALLVASVPACSDDPLLPSPSERIRVAFDQDPSTWPRDSWTLTEASVEGDTLTMEVQFAGGCRTHDFWLLAVDGWVELPTAGPLDARAVPLLLAHDDRGDACEAAVTRRLRFDLDPLRRAYRARFGDAPARLFLRVPTAQGSSDVLPLEWEI